MISISSAEWSECLRQMEVELVSPVTDKLGIPLEQTMARLFDGPYQGDAYGYLFEEAGVKARMEGSIFGRWECQQQHKVDPPAVWLPSFI